MNLEMSNKLIIAPKVINSPINVPRLEQLHKGDITGGIILRKQREGFNYGLSDITKMNIFSKELNLIKVKLKRVFEESLNLLSTINNATLSEREISNYKDGVKEICKKEFENNQLLNYDPLSISLTNVMINVDYNITNLYRLLDDLLDGKRIKVRDFAFDIPGLMLVKLFSNHNILGDKITSKVKNVSIYQQEKLFKAFKKEGIPCKYFVSDQRCGADEFATDCGTLINYNNKGKYIAANFKGTYRRSETFSATLHLNKQIGLPVTFLTDIKYPLVYEGGDIRKMPGFNLWFIGGGIATGTSPDTMLREYEDVEIDALKNVAKVFAAHAKAPVVPLKLLHRDYFHLDCCFLPLPEDNEGKPWAVIYKGHSFKPTMDKNSFKILEKLYGKDHLIEISQLEAENFATNSVVAQNKAGEKCIFHPENSFSQSTKDKLSRLGYKLIGVEYDTFHKLKGSIRCTCFEVPNSLKDEVFRSLDDSTVHDQIKFMEEPDNKKLFRTKDDMLYYERTNVNYAKNRNLSYDKILDMFILK